MDHVEHIFAEFVDALHTAKQDDEFERIAARLTNKLGFRWFAYLAIGEAAPKIISSYPVAWTRRYSHRKYHRLDPVIMRARAEHKLFSWEGDSSRRGKSVEQRKFFDEAASFGIRSGLTVPIRSGFEKVAAFTFAGEERLGHPDRLLEQSADIIQLAGLYFHSHVVGMGRLDPIQHDVSLTQRERQCLAWAARGKTASETAVLMALSARTISFHLENARRKMAAVSITHCIALAVRYGLLS